MKIQKPRYPNREYLGMFESWLLTMGRSSSSMRLHDAILERFFAMFPRKTGVEQFTSVDVGDYKAVRLQQGTPQKSLTYELNMLDHFWTWLIEDKKLPLNDPVRASRKPFKLGTVVRKGDVSLREVNRLLDECPLPAKRVVLKVMSGESAHTNRRCGRFIKEAAVRAGLTGFSLCMLKNLTMSRLSRDIVQDYCLQKLNALPVEAESKGDSLANIQVSALDERPPIRDCNDDLPIISGVDEQQLSTEGECLMGNSHGHLVESMPISHESTHL